MNDLNNHWEQNQEGEQYFDEKLRQIEPEDFIEKVIDRYLRAKHQIDRATMKLPEGVKKNLYSEFIAYYNETFFEYIKKYE